MKRRLAVSGLVIMTLIFVIGLIILFKATAIGRNAGSMAVRAQGGSMDSGDFQQIVEGTTRSYQLGGSVIALTGGCGVILSGVGLYKEI
ncbi:MAG: hypothetical protein VB111_05740 [Clostridiaceae bacterium]|nr:hypothetical protein [Clostridiaceae bacterium]